MSPDSFFSLAERLNGELTGAEVLFCSLDGETSEFVRLNNNRIRQAGAVRAAGLGLCLIDGSKQADGACDLTGDADQDLDRARSVLGRLRERVPHLPDDPYLNYSTAPTDSERRVGEAAPDALEAVTRLIGAAEGLDLVGIWASGEILTGLASSLGHRHLHLSVSFNLDWSCYLDSGKAVKASYSGFCGTPGPSSSSWRPCGRGSNHYHARRGLWRRAATAPTWRRGPFRS